MRRHARTRAWPTPEHLAALLACPRPPQDVSFRYPARPAHRVLTGLSLAVQPGEIVALVGPSGGGKSSIVKLVERFYLPDEGGLAGGACGLGSSAGPLHEGQPGGGGSKPMPASPHPIKHCRCPAAAPCPTAPGAVLIDDRPVGDYDRKWLKQRVALVSQVRPAGRRARHGGCARVGGAARWAAAWLSNWRRLARRVLPPLNPPCSLALLRVPLPPPAPPGAGAGALRPQRAPQHPVRAGGGGRRAAGAGAHARGRGAGGAVRWGALGRGRGLWAWRDAASAGRVCHGAGPPAAAHAMCIQALRTLRDHTATVSNLTRSLHPAGDPSAGYKTCTLLATPLLAPARAGLPTPTTSSRPCPTATTPSAASAACS